MKLFHPLCRLRAGEPMRLPGKRNIVRQDEYALGEFL
jgi:hypothetical protein